MMVPHYTLVELVYCSCSDLAGQACGVSFLEQEVMVLVGQVVKVKEWEESCIGASSPDEMHSTEVGVDHRI